MSAVTKPLTWWAASPPTLACPSCSGYRPIGFIPEEAGGIGDEMSEILCRFRRKVAKLVPECQITEIVRE